MLLYVRCRKNSFIIPVVLRRSVQRIELLCVNSDADKTLAQWESRYVRNCYLTVVKRFKIQICFVTSEYVMFVAVLGYSPYFSVKIL